MFGGPAGALLGAGLAAWLSQEEQGPGGGVPEIVSHLQWVEEPDGLVLKLSSSVVRPEHVAYRILTHNGTLREGCGPFVDDDGAFVLLASWQDGASLAFLHHGATPRRSKQDVLLAVYLGANGDVLGTARFQGVPRTGRTWSPADMFRPLIHLALRVGRADGTLDRREVAAIRQALDLDSAADQQVRAIMKEACDDSITLLVMSAAARLPGLEPADILGLLIDVACADDHVDDAEVRIIAEVADVLGIAESMWRSFLNARRGSATVGSDAVDDDLKMLGLQGAVTETEVRNAYRALMKQHHPDRHATRGPHAEQQAMKQTLEIRAAYDRLKAARAWETSQSSTPLPDAAERAGAAQAREGAERRQEEAAERQRREAADACARQEREAKARRGEEARKNEQRHRHERQRQEKAHAEAERARKDRELRQAASDAGGPSTPPQPVPRAPPASQASIIEPGVFDVDEESRIGMGIVGAIIGFVIGIPFAGFGALPGAFIGFYVGAYLPEVGCAAVVVIGLVLLAAFLLLMLIAAAL